MRLAAVSEAGGCGGTVAERSAEAPRGMVLPVQDIGAAFPRAPDEAGSVPPPPDAGPIRSPPEGLAPHAFYAEVLYSVRGFNVSFRTDGGADGEVVLDDR